MSEPEPTRKPGDEQPKTQPETPLSLMRDHVVAARNFGYSYMLMTQILTMIDLAEEGKLGKFDPKF